MLMRQSMDQGKRNRLFINITGRTLRNKSLLPWFAEQLRSMRLPADHLVFQISEADALASPAYYKAFCKALHKLHCKICLKHYGSTSESDYILADIPVDYIKLDGSYLRDLNRNSLSTRQLESVIRPLKKKKHHVDCSNGRGHQPNGHPLPARYTDGSGALFTATTS
jgi:EAL domain-containing protein (putative c-di-GMP-specific phosphodiesterase class I)